MLAFILFTLLTIAIFLSAIAVFSDQIKRDPATQDSLKDIFNDK